MEVIVHLNLLNVEKSVSAESFFHWQKVVTIFRLFDLTFLFDWNQCERLH